MIKTDLGLIIGYYPDGMPIYLDMGDVTGNPPSGQTGTAKKVTTAQNNYYGDPEEESDDTYGDPGELPPPIEYLPITFHNNTYFTLFTVASGDGNTINAASYPYQATETGRQVFSYNIVPTAEGTDFTISDYSRDFTVSIEEQLYGRFCSLLMMQPTLMTIKVWGGMTTEPFASLSHGGRVVSFDHEKICRGL